MNQQEQINNLSIQIARKSKFNEDEIQSERTQRINENTQIQVDIVECVVDEYNAVIGG